MNKSTVILFFPCLLLAGCGVKGPLTLPPNPNDSYLPRIEKSLNELTGQTTASETPPPASKLQVTEQVNGAGDATSISEEEMTSVKSKAEPAQ